jgi:hypothetical protein
VLLPVDATIRATREEAFVREKKEKLELNHRLFEDLIGILQTIVNGENVKFWNKQVPPLEKMRQCFDGDRIKVNGKYYAAPRGIYRAHQALKKITRGMHPIDKEIHLKVACVAMKNRLDDSDREKPTSVLYSAVSELFLVGPLNRLHITEEKLDIFNQILQTNPQLAGQLKGV